MSRFVCLKASSELRMVILAPDGLIAHVSYFLFHWDMVRREMAQCLP